MDVKKSCKTTPGAKGAGRLLAKSVANASCAQASKKSPDKSPVLDEDELQLVWHKLSKMLKQAFNKLIDTLEQSFYNCLSAQRKLTDSGFTLAQFWFWNWFGSGVSEPRCCLVNQPAFTPVKWNQSRRMSFRVTQAEVSRQWQNSRSCGLFTSDCFVIAAICSHPTHQHAPTDDDKT